MAETRYFTKEVFRFLGDLAANNDRAFFTENKARYEQHARDPFLRLIADLGPRLAKVSPHIVVDPRPVGGSMMRIHRDIRFSRDKTPYKTSLAAQFAHAEGKGTAPGFYLRIAPGESAVGAGIWRPEPAAVKQIRDAIAANAKGWQKAVKGREQKSGCGMIGESLKRPPAGYDPDHPCIEDLKRKDFALSVPIADRDVVSADLVDRVVEELRGQKPFVGFLCAAMDLPF